MKILGIIIFIALINICVDKLSEPSSIIVTLSVILIGLSLFGIYKLSLPSIKQLFKQFKD